LHVKRNILHLCEGAFADDITRSSFQSKLIEYFVTALNDRDIAMEVYRRKPETLEQAYDFALYYENCLLENKIPRAAVQSMEPTIPATVASIVPVHQPKPQKAVQFQPMPEIDRLTKSMVDLQATIVRQQQQQTVGPVSAVVQAAAPSVAPVSDNARSRDRSSSSRGKSRAHVDWSTFLCWNCGQIGHGRMRCPHAPIGNGMSYRPR
jgi:hypothetical protein